MVTSSTGQRGLASTDLDGLTRRVLAAWDAFLDTAGSLPLDARSRLPGWHVRELLIHLGTWDDHDAIGDAVATAESGATATTRDPDVINAAVIAAHKRASDDEVWAALLRTRDNAERVLTSAGFAAMAERESASWLGPMPLASQLHATCYELAVHALDLEPAGARRPAYSLLDAGLAALVDVTGALATRHGIRVTFAAQAEQGGWRATSQGGGWHTERVGTSGVAGAVVRGDAHVVLDASAGRVSVPGLLLRRKLKVSDVGEFLKLGTLVSEVPTLPGGPVLAKAVGAMNGLAGRFARR